LTQRVGDGGTGAHLDVGGVVEVRHGLRLFRSPTGLV
jgi:hypothetical protein